MLLLHNKEKTVFLNKCTIILILPIFSSNPKNQRGENALSCLPPSSYVYANELHCLKNILVYLKSARLFPCFHGSSHFIFFLNLFHLCWSSYILMESYEFEPQKVQTKIKFIILHRCTILGSLKI